MIAMSGRMPALFHVSNFNVECERFVGTNDGTIAALAVSKARRNEQFSFSAFFEVRQPSVHPAITLDLPMVTGYG